MSLHRFPTGCTVDWVDGRYMELLAAQITKWGSQSQHDPGEVEKEAIAATELGRYHVLRRLQTGHHLSLQWAAIRKRGEEYLQC